MDGMGFSAGSQFPPGFRFHPSDQELIIHYLRNKITSSKTMFTSIIADVNIYKFNPWDLPKKAFFGEGEWFFFSPRDRKYPNGARPNRAAGCGYWKATGTDKPILASGGSKCLGVKKALVFYKGRPPKGIKTDWVMHEYRLLDTNPSLPQKNKGTSMRLDDWVLCRVRHKGSTPAQSAETEAEAEAEAQDGLSAETSSGQNIPKAKAKAKSKEVIVVESGNNNLYANNYPVTDCQLFEDIRLIGSLEEDTVGGGGGDQMSSDNSNLPFTDCTMAFNGGSFADQMQQPNLVSSMDDQFMFQMPNKTLHFANNGSPSLSFYVDHDFPNLS